MKYLFLFISILFSSITFSQDTIYAKPGDIVVIQDTTVQIMVQDDLDVYLVPNTVINNIIYEMKFGALPVCPPCPVPSGTPWSSSLRTYGITKYRMNLYTIPGNTLFGFYTMKKL